MCQIGSALRLLLVSLHKDVNTLFKILMKATLSPEGKNKYIDMNLAHNFREVQRTTEAAHGHPVRNTSFRGHLAV